MAQVFGSIDAFGFDTDDITEWFERLEQWFVANNIDDGTRKRALLLSNIGARGYKLARSLSQNKPTEKSFEELKKLLLDHINPKPNEISQRFVFYRRDRRAGETVKDYVAQLRKLSEHCNFGDNLEENLRDKFVCGLNDAGVQQKLLATKNVTLQTAIETSVAMEAAAKSAKQIHGVGLEGVHRLGDGSKYPSNVNNKSAGRNNSNVNRGGNKECYRCGSQRHLADKCPFKNSECFYCKKRGHTRQMCRKAGAANRQGVNVNLIEEAESEENEFEISEEIEIKESDLHVLNLYRLGDETAESNDPIMITMKCNKKEVTMEVDTGAAVTVMSITLFRELEGGKLEISNLRLRTYTGEIISPLGVGWLVVEYNSITMELPVTVLKGSVPTLLGRNWMTQLNINWDLLFPPRELRTHPSAGAGQRKITKVNKLGSKQKSGPSEGNIVELPRSGNKKIEKLVEELKSKHPEILRKCLKLWESKQASRERVNVSDMKAIFPEVFRAELGCLKGVKINIPVSEEAKPKFFKARSVPYALKSRVEDELDKLEGQGVWKKVKYSKWAAPVVVVLKDAKDPAGSIRICGDYKITANTAAPCDTYPIPNTNEQLASLAGGRTFSKIDLSQAYQQLELDEASRELLTVNTHRGLYQPDRLQFGVHSATGIFQREMEKVLSGIVFVLVRIDDILLTGQCDWDHFIVLVNVLNALEKAGLTVNLKKCKFFQDEITFCGYTISRMGIKPMQSNVDAVLSAPEPSNVSEVKSFLGMINYYQSYLPSLSTVVEPIHKLLRKGIEWSWGSEQRQAFSRAKKMLSEAPLLVHFDPSRKIVVHTDASPYGLGGVLSHEYDDNTERPVCFASRSLTASERNYGHIEKEGLALVFAVKKFHHYLFGHKFNIYTDHKPLLGLFGENKAIPDRSAARIARWALMLSAYNYQLLYRQGVLNGNADALSRLPLPVVEGDASQQVYSVHMMELVHAPVTEKDVARETACDQVLAEVLKQVLEGWKNEVRDEKLRPYWLRRTELSCESGCLLWGTRVVIPESLRKTVLMELHDVHPGTTRMKMLSRSYMWWPKMDEEIEGITKTCSTCAVNQSNPAAAPSHPWETPSGPWIRIHMDFAGPFMGKMFLIVVDAYSKWVEVTIMNEATSVSTVNKLRRMFSTHGLPQVSVSDNGPAFVGEEFKEFMKKNGVKQVYSAPYHPASNGQAERMVRTFKEAMKTLKTGDLQTKLDRLLYKYRIMPHSTTGKTPAQMMFNRELRTPFHFLRPGSQTTQESSPAELKTKTRSLQEGDLVWARNFGKGDEIWLAGKVSKKLGNVTYEIEFQDKNKETSNRHIDHLKTRKLVEVAEETQELIEVEDIRKEGTLPDPAPRVPSEPSSDALRKSTRVCQKPAWTKDFVAK